MVLQVQFRCFKGKNRKIIVFAREARKFFLVLTLSPPHLRPFFESLLPPPKSWWNFLPPPKLDQSSLHPPILDEHSLPPWFRIPHHSGCFWHLPFIQGYFWSMAGCAAKAWWCGICAITARFIWWHSHSSFYTLLTMIFRMPYWVYCTN